MFLFSMVLDLGDFMELLWCLSYICLSVGNLRRKVVFMKIAFKKNLSNYVLISLSNMRSLLFTQRSLTTPNH